ncbi:MAG: anti-sigma factor antagonist [Enterocloster clostridioformis]|nr:anti-sigma factor antagonist [Enterocloster clostridioformis]
MEQTTFTYEAREQMLVIHLPKELDHHNCRNLKRDTDLLLAENYINRIVFDFTHTSFMDSSGIGVLLNRYKQMAASRGTVAYYGAGPQVRRILEMGGVSRLIKGYEDRESAIKGQESAFGTSTPLAPHS